MTDELELEAALRAEARFEAEQELAAQQALTPPTQQEQLDSALQSSSYASMPFGANLISSAINYLGENSKQAYSGIRDYGVPVAQLGVDVATSIPSSIIGSIPGAQALPVVMQPAISAGIGGVIENAVRSAGVMSDEYLGTNFEPGKTYGDVNRESGMQARNAAGYGIATGGAFNVAGRAVGKVGTIFGNLFDRQAAKRSILFDPIELATREGLDKADETIEILSKEGAFPYNPGSKNMLMDSADQLKLIQEREAATLGSLRAQASQSAPKVTGDDIFNNKATIDRLEEWNSLGRSTKASDDTVTNLWQAEAGNKTPMSISDLAEYKNNIKFTGKTFEGTDSVRSEAYKSLYMQVKQTEEDMMRQYLPKDQFDSYMKSRDLYSRTSQVVGDVGMEAGQAASRASIAKPLGASVGNSSGARLFGSASNLINEPAEIQRYTKAFTPQGPVGNFMGGAGASGMKSLGYKMRETSGLAGSLGGQSGAGEFTEPLKATNELLSNLTEPKPVAIPRNLNQIDAAAIEMLIPSFVETHNAQPLVFQWKRLVAEGDKQKIGDFLGQFSNKYPDFPLQRGAVTGLPSEFDLGDGVARLMSDRDIGEYVRRVDASDLPVHEKAERVKQIREKGIAHRFDARLLVDNGQVIKSPSSQGYQFSPRVQTDSGSRKVE
jgi:hypothetical protein